MHDPSPAVQELVGWLDTCCDGARGMLPEDAAVVALAAFEDLCAADTATWPDTGTGTGADRAAGSGVAAAALDSDTNIRWVGV